MISINKDNNDNDPPKPLLEASIAFYYTKRAEAIRREVPVSNTSLVPTDERDLLLLWMYSSWSYPRPMLTPFHLPNSWASLQNRKFLFLHHHFFLCTDSFLSVCKHAAANPFSNRKSLSWPHLLLQLPPGFGFLPQPLASQRLSNKLCVIPIIFSGSQSTQALELPAKTSHGNIPSHFHVVDSNIHSQFQSDCFLLLEIPSSRASTHPTVLVVFLYLQVPLTHHCLFWLFFPNS